MSHWRSPRGILCLLATLGLLAAWPAARLAASELEESSIRLIPADAAFYGASLRNGEQIHIIAESNAWKKLTNMPSVQQGLGMLKSKLEDQEDDKAAQARAVLENPQVKDLLGLLGDMFSDDVFCYGSAEVGEVVELIQDVANASNYGPMYFMAAGEGDAMSQGEMQGKAALYALAKNVDKIQIPTAVMGFSVEDQQRATVHVGKLEGFLSLLTLMQPQFTGRVVRQEVEGSQFLTLTLDGKMIPWDDVPLDKLRELESHEGDVDKIVEKVTQLKLVVAFGVREGYLMMAMTDSLENLAKLGKGDGLLSRPELAVVKKHADQRLTGISYASKDFVSRVSMSPQDLDELLKVGDSALKQLPLQDEAKERIRKDATELVKDLKRLIPKPGAAVGCSFLTDKGMEAYSHSWTENKVFNGSGALDLLNHVGGDPLLAIVWREHEYPKVYDRIVHWVRIGHKYFEEFAVPEMSEGDRAKYRKLVELGQPLCKDLDRVNRESLIPAFDGQGAIVVDARLKSKKIAADVPETNEAMPLLEPAVVVGIKDSQAMRDAYLGYQKFFNELLEVARQMDDEGKIPDDYQIPWPEASDEGGKATLSYAFPGEWGVDKQIRPNAVLVDKLAVVTASDSHSARLLKAAPLAASGALADPAKARAVAVMFNWAATVDAVRPWVRLAARETAKKQLQVEDDDPKIDAIVAQAETVLDVLKAIRRCTAECYFEDGAMVTHSMTEIQDVE
ncbi:MAG: hypothetical protein ACYC6Y_02780 [Thermoguttaceae bacterium]